MAAETNEELSDAVSAFIRDQAHQSFEARNAALRRLARLLENLVRERLDDRELAASLDGLNAYRTRVDEHGQLEITGFFYALATESGRSTNHAVPMDAHLSLKPGEVSLVRVATADTQLQMRPSEREFRRAIESANWRYNLEVRLA